MTVLGYDVRYVNTLHDSKTSEFTGSTNEEVDLTRFRFFNIVNNRRIVEILHPSNLQEFYIVPLTCHSEIMGDVEKRKEFSYQIKVPYAVTVDDVMNNRNVQLIDNIPKFRFYIERSWQS